MTRVNPLRAFLLVRLRPGEWIVEAHRELESIFASWESKSRSESPVTAILHIGFGRPEAQAFDEVCVKWPGHLLLTASSKFALGRFGVCAPDPVGVVEGIPIYLSTNILGHGSVPNQLESISPRAEESALRDHDNNGTAFFPVVTVDWFGALRTMAPGVADTALRVGINSEESYISNEWKLEPKVRKAIGLWRFKILFGASKKDDPGEIIRLAPPWFMHEPLAAFGFSVRVSNALERARIKTIDDLAKYTVNDLLTISNLGRKSIRDISRALLSKIGVTQQQLSQIASIEKVVDSEDQSATTAALVGSENNIVDMLRGVLNTLSERQRLVLKHRIGFGVKKSTLQEIANTISVTRERVRQIESKAITRVAQLSCWGEVLIPKLQALLDDRSEPLPLFGLEILDEWFAGVEEIPESFSFILENFCASEFSVIRANEQLFVSRLAQHEWDEAVSQGKRILESAIGEDLREAQVRVDIDALLLVEGKELREELWAAVGKYAHFVFSETGDRVLVQYGRGVEQHVEAVLVESDRPLHYSEIAEAVMKRSGKEVDLRRAHHAAAAVGLLMGRGTFGLMKHYPLSSEETELVVAEVEDVIESGAAGRQWSCAELCEVLGERGIELDDRLTIYTLNIALQKSRSLAYLGRFVWSRAEGMALSSAHRIDMRQAVVALLRAEGRPLTIAEVRDKLTQNRGLSAHFQIHPIDPLIQLAPGLWGLIDRDLPFDGTEQAAVLEELESVLRGRGTGLHVSELVESMRDTKGVVQRAEDPAVIFALAKRTGRMSVSPGQVVYMTEWGEPRRIRVPDAVKMALTRAGTTGLSMNELLDAASLILERHINRASIYTTLSSIGARWDEEANHWILVDESGNDSYDAGQ